MLVQTNPPSMPTDRRPAQELLRWNELVCRYRICWEVWPEHLLVDGKKAQVGFELVLIGAHEPGAHPEPGCALCAEILKPLSEMAEWIVPKVVRASRYDIEIHNNAIQGRQQRKFHPEVSVSIRILHRLGFDQPVDACEVSCLHEMEEKLKSIGVQHQIWNPKKVKKLGR